MRRIKIVGFLVVFLVLVWSTTAYAGGWWFEFGTGPDRTPAPSDFPQGDYSTTGHVQQWGNPNTTAGNGTPSPHGGFSTSTNLCKTCHAVHLAASDSYRLLHDSSRITECDWCHDGTSGRSSHRPYGEMALKGYTVRGEHTLRTATLIPDSSVNRGIYGTEPNEVELHEKGRLPNRSVGDRTVSGNGLYCFDCHSVHGAGVIGSPDPWVGDIIRVDPAGNGGNVATDGLDAIEEPGKHDPPGSPGDEEIMTAFCGDCHNINPNWTYPSDVRDNLRSHPINTNGVMEVYHDPVVVSDANNVTSCMSCHSATNFEALKAIAGFSDFPHQSQGHKLLDDSYTAAWPWSGIDTGDPQRPVPNMDFVCLQCHQWSGVGGTEGVGLTF